MRGAFIHVVLVSMLLAMGRAAPDPTDDEHKLGCSFGGENWPHESILTEACFKLKCVDGTWQYTTGNIDPDCGECKLKGDPHITTFDQSQTTDRDGSTITSKYLLSEAGDYVITQPGFDVPASFGVNGRFAWCEYLYNSDRFRGYCIYEASYYQPGIDITLILPPRKIAAGCTEGNPARDPACDIKVSVSGSLGPFIPIGDSVEYFYGLNGAILVFKHNDIGENADNLNCITIVGSKGFSVSLCEYYSNLPSFYVWAMPSLKSAPTSQLHGLCNTYTGNNADAFELQDKTNVSSEKCLTWTDEEGGAWESCNTFSGSWRPK